MAELEDAQVSGTCGKNPMEVQVLLPASLLRLNLKCKNQNLKFLNFNLYF